MVGSILPILYSPCPSCPCILYLLFTSSSTISYIPPPSPLPPSQVSGPGDFTLLVDPNDDNGTAYIAYGGHHHHIKYNIVAYKKNEKLLQNVIFYNRKIEKSNLRQFLTSPPQMPGGTTTPWWWSSSRGTTGPPPPPPISQNLK